MLNQHKNYIHLLLLYIVHSIFFSFYIFFCSSRTRHRLRYKKEWFVGLCLQCFSRDKPIDLLVNDCIRIAYNKFTYVYHFSSFTLPYILINPINRSSPPISCNIFTIFKIFSQTFRDNISLVIYVHKK